MAARSRIVGWVLLAAACKFDSLGAGLGDSGGESQGTPTGSTTTTTTGVTTSESTTTVSPATESSSTTSAGSTSVSTTSAGSSSGGSSSTGVSPALTDDGVLVRYYLDEAASGTDAVQALDASPVDPLPLVNLYRGSSMSYVESGGNRGLTWAASGEDGAPTIPLQGTKLEMLDGLAASTIEVVVEVLDVTPSFSRISYIGFDQQLGDWTILADRTDEIMVIVNETIRGEFDVDFAAGRKVLHVAFDSSEAAEDRVIAYVDGVRTTVSNYVAPGAGETLNIETDIDSYALGNRAVGDRSFQGTLYYAAIYSRALTPAEVAMHAVLLARDDDRRR